VDKEYNGWTNYETWAVNLWIDNDQGTQEFWREQAERARTNAVGTQYRTRDRIASDNLAATLRESHESDAPESEGVFGDLISAALGSVNWREIADALLEDLDPDDDECRECGGENTDGEGYDGLCGSCADKAEPDDDDDDDTSHARREADES